jgi:hypothetical protein
VTTALVDLTSGEAKILAHYAAGDEFSLIAQKTGTKTAEVNRVVMEIAQFNVAHARALAVAWQRKNNPGVIGQAIKPPEVAKPAEAIKPPEVAKPAEAIKPAEATKPMMLKRDVIADLLNRAVASEVPALIRLADRAQDLVDQLEQKLAEYDQGRALRAEAAQLEQRLAEIKQELTGKKASPGPSAVMGPDNATVRAWAGANGVECPARGRIPGAVTAAYLKAVAS